MTSVTHPLHTETQCVYDDWGHATSMSDLRGNPRTCSFAAGHAARRASGLLTKAERYDHTVTNYRWDSACNVIDEEHGHDGEGQAMSPSRRQFFGISAAAVVVAGLKVQGRRVVIDRRRLLVELWLCGIVALAVTTCTPTIGAGRRVTHRDLRNAFGNTSVLYVRLPTYQSSRLGFYILPWTVDLPRGRYKLTLCAPAPAGYPKGKHDTIGNGYGAFCTFSDPDAPTDQSKMIGLSDHSWDDSAGGWGRLREERRLGQKILAFDLEPDLDVKDESRVFRVDITIHFVGTKSQRGKAWFLRFEKDADTPTGMLNSTPNSSVTRGPDKRRGGGREWRRPATPRPTRGPAH